MLKIQQLRKCLQSQGLRQVKNAWALLNNTPTQYFSVSVLFKNQSKYVTFLYNILSFFLLKLYFYFYFEDNVFFFLHPCMQLSKCAGLLRLSLFLVPLLLCCCLIKLFILLSQATLTTLSLQFTLCLCILYV